MDVLAQLGFLIALDLQKLNADRALTHRTDHRGRDGDAGSPFGGLELQPQKRPQRERAFHPHAAPAHRDVRDHFPRTEQVGDERRHAGGGESLVLPAVKGLRQVARRRAEGPKLRRAELTPERIDPKQLQERVGHRRLVNDSHKCGSTLGAMGLFHRPNRKKPFCPLGSRKQNTTRPGLISQPPSRMQHLSASYWAHSNQGLADPQEHPGQSGTTFPIPRERSSVSQWEQIPLG